MKYCSVDGCDEKHCAFGLCKKHYWPAKRKGLLGGTTCAQENCTFVAVSRGFCKKHYIYNKRRFMWGGNVCKGENCKKLAEIRGYCPECYVRLRRLGFISVNKCSIPGCNTEVLSHGMCGIHSYRLLANGDPLKILTRPKGTGTISSSGYPQAWMPGNPMADKRGLVMVHRLVMAESLGRPLLPNERVHHKDGDRLNHDIKNLELWVILILFFSSINFLILN